MCRSVTAELTRLRRRKKRPSGSGIETMARKATACGHPAQASIRQLTKFFAQSTEVTLCRSHRRSSSSSPKCRLKKEATVLQTLCRIVRVDKVHMDPDRKVAAETSEVSTKRRLYPSTTWIRTEFRPSCKICSGSRAEPPSPPRQAELGPTQIRPVLAPTPRKSQSRERWGLLGCKSRCALRRIDKIARNGRRLALYLG